MTVGVRSRRRRVQSATIYFCSPTLCVLPRSRALARLYLYQFDKCVTKKETHTRVDTVSTDDVCVSRKVILQLQGL